MKVNYIFYHGGLKCSVCRLSVSGGFVMPLTPSFPTYVPIFLPALLFSLLNLPFHRSLLLTPAPPPPPLCLQFLLCHHPCLSVFLSTSLLVTSYLNNKKGITLSLLLCLLLSLCVSFSYEKPHWQNSTKTM